MNIIRIAHPETGKGIYRHCSSAEVYRALDERGSSQAHPVPMKDSLFKKNLEEYCLNSGRSYPNTFYSFNLYFGFKSISQLKRWIYNNEMIEVLEENGFKLYTFKADSKDCVIGNTQVAFDLEKSKLTKTEELSILKD